MEGSTPSLPGAVGGWGASAPHPSEAGHAQHSFVAASCVLFVGLGVSPIRAIAGTAS